MILIGTGSEVDLCVEAYEELTAEGIAARVVSMPSWELFERQDEPTAQRCCRRTLPHRVAVEQATMIGWDGYVGRPCQDRHAQLRLVGAVEGAAGEIRVYAGDNVDAAAKQQLARKE